MNIVRTSLLALVVPVLAAAAPPDAAANCLATGGSPVLPGHVLIVDGDRVGEYTSSPGAGLPPAEEILLRAETCVPAAASGGSDARQAATVVVTKKGASRLLNLYLRDLVAAQEEYRATVGEYTSDLEQLGFFEAHIEIPIEMEIGDMGWFAAATVPGSNTTCAVTVGTYSRDPRFTRSGLGRSGRPVCRRN